MQCLINLDNYSNIGTHWIGLYALNDNFFYFNSFLVEYIPKEIKKIRDRSLITTNVYRIQAYNSVICEYFCIKFINSMLEGKSLTDFTNVFSPNDNNKKDYIVLSYFKNG